MSVASNRFRISPGPNCGEAVIISQHGLPVRAIFGKPHGLEARATGTFFRVENIGERSDEGSAHK